MMYQTSATHRILNKEGVDVNGQEKLISNGDEHFVFVRPKQIVNSSGTTWVNETHRLRCELPDSFEVSNNDVALSFPKEVRCFASSVQGDVYLFHDMSEKEDIDKVTASPSCLFREYEKKRLKHLVKKIEKAESELALNVNQLESTITEILNKIRICVTTLTEETLLLLNKLEGSTTVSWDDYGTMLQKCKNLLDLLKSLDLPFVRPRWAEFTDAGPGVGVNNSEVSFRDAELARIYCYDYRIRVHRGAGDSGQNEAERTNLAIGDSVVDGATINWEHHKRFEGLSEDEIASLSLEEYEKAGEERIERNACKVANEIAARIDDAPVHSEYIKCFVAHKGEDGLFFNQD